MVLLLSAVDHSAARANNSKPNRLVASSTDPENGAKTSEFKSENFIALIKIRTRYLSNERLTLLLPRHRASYT